MNRPALILTASALGLLYAAARRGAANVESGDALPSISLENLTDTATSIYYQATETPTDDTDTSMTNINAFLKMIQRAEGTARAADPYAVCYGYKHTVSSFADHPAVTGEWAGEVLPDNMCANAGFGAGCKSTAAGAYQIIKPTWTNLKTKLGLPDFSAASQDAAAVQLIRTRGALEDVKAGRISAAIAKCRNEWASLPGNYAKQGQRSVDELVGWYQSEGGAVA